MIRLGCSPRSAFAALSIAAASFGFSNTAGANSRYPEADQLVVSADRPGFLLARTTFGFVLSNDAGAHWSWVCEDAIGFSGVEDPTVGLMENGVIVASLLEGISRCSDLGCNWGFADADVTSSLVIDLTVRKEQPSSALALVWDTQTVSYSSRFLHSEDNGQSFADYGNPIDPSVLVSTLDTAKTDAHRLYASGTRELNGVRAGLFFASFDDGQHWTESSVPFDPDVEQGVYIAAVDPENADTVYVRSNGTTSRLLVTHDAGQHFDVAYSGSLLAFALSPDGSRLYFGGEDGLHTGLASDLVFEQRATVRLLCLAATSDTLYACSDEQSGFTVGASNDDGLTFAPLLHLKTVAGPLACGAGDSVAACVAEWPLVSAELGISSVLPDAGADAGASPAPAPQHSGSCAFVAVRDGASRASALALIAVALFGFARRRSARRRSAREHTLVARHGEAGASSVIG